MKLRIHKPLYLSPYDNCLVIPLASREKGFEIVQLQEKAKKGLEVEFKPFNEKRTKDANGYLWILCDKIAKHDIFKGTKTTKETIYKDAIKEVGVFDILPIKAEAVAEWIRKWQARGLGWYSEVMEDSKLQGYKKVISYWGSSSYNTKEMADLIDYVVSQATELGIETLTPRELEQLKSSWNMSKSVTTATEKHE